MKLSVIQRISAGFLFLLICLVVIAIFAITSLNNINSGMKVITDQANPISRYSNDLTINLQATNLVMFEHYSAKSVDKFDVLETQFSELQKQYNSLSEQLLSQLAMLEGSDEQLEQLKVLSVEVPEVWIKIEKNMKVYRDSFSDFNQISSLKQNVVDYENEIIELYEKIFKLEYVEKDLKTINALYPQIVRGLGLIKQLTLAGDTVTLNEVNDEIVLWMQAYAKVGIKTLSIGRRTPDAKPLFKENGRLIGELTGLVNSPDGITDTMSVFLANELALVQQLEKNQNTLNELIVKINGLKKFGEDYSSVVTSDASANVSSAATIILSVSVIASLAGIIIVFLVVISINKPLKFVVKVLQTIATGNLTQTLNKHAADEFGLLTKAAEQVNTSLKEMITSINSESSALVKSVEHSHELTQKALSDVSEQKTETDMVATAMHEMTMTIKDVAENAEVAYEEMQNAHEYATQSQDTVLTNKNESEALLLDMNDAVDIIHNLDEDVKSIGEILQVIESIAEQTNLLALNAAIEAARAGEQGRGFAVVADEVRTLAGRTQDSTEEIKLKISSMTSGSNDAVKAIEGNQHKTETAVERGAEVHSQIDSFVQVITKAKDYNMQIATAAEQQSRTAEEINNNVIKISDLADNTETGVKDGATNVDNLRTSASSLRQLIKQFQI